MLSLGKFDIRAHFGHRLALPSGQLYPRPPMMNVPDISIGTHLRRGDYIIGVGGVIISERCLMIHIHAERFLASHRAFVETQVKLADV